MTAADQLHLLWHTAKRAEESCPGSWEGDVETDDLVGEQHVVRSESGEIVVGLIWYDGPQLMMSDEVKAHIAEFDPPTVLEMINSHIAALSKNRQLLSLLEMAEELLFDREKGGEMWLSNLAVWREAMSRAKKEGQGG